MTRSIHDNHVLGYTVDHLARTIVVRTVCRELESHERTHVCFDGVLGYHLRDGLGGILFGVEETSIEDLVAGYAPLFEDGARYGWPFQGASGDPGAYVRARQGRAFLIESSIGFDGFVVCREMRIVAADGQ